MELEYCHMREIINGANACGDACAWQPFCVTIRALEQRISRLEEHQRECKR
jgi:hypothetical protein